MNSLVSFMGKPSENDSRRLTESVAAIENRKKYLKDICHRQEQFAKAVACVVDAGRQLSDSVESYTDELYGSPNPDVVVAHTSMSKLRILHKQWTDLTSEMCKAMTNKLTEPLNGILEFEMKNALDGKKKFDHARDRYDTVLRKYGGRPEAWSTTPDELLVAQNAFKASKLEAKKAATFAIACMNTQSVRQFTELYTIMWEHSKHLQGLLKSLEPEQNALCKAIGAASVVSSNTEIVGVPLGADPVMRPVSKMLSTIQKYSYNLKTLKLLSVSTIAQKGELKLADGDITRLFGNLAEVVAFDSRFTIALENALKSTTPASVARAIIAEYDNLLGVYQRYTLNICIATTLLEDLRKNKLFAGLLRTVEYSAQSMEATVDVQQMLLSPTRYVRVLLPLLEEILELTPSGTSAWDALGEAIDLMAEVADTLEEAVVVSKKMAEVDAIQQKMTGLMEDLVIPSRRYVEEGDVTLLLPAAAAGTAGTAASPMGPARQPNMMMMGSGSGGPTHRLYIFSDVAVLTQKSGKGFLFSAAETYKFVAKAPLIGLTVKLLDEAEAGSKNAFLLQWGNGRETESLALAAQSAAQASEWQQLFISASHESSKTQLFGIDLSRLMDREKGRDIPHFVEDSIEYIRKEALRSEGIFRLSGQQREMAQVQTLLDAGGTPRFDDCNNVAGLLKLWLRLLPEPLLTTALAGEWGKYTEKAVSEDSPVVQGLRATVGRMPQYNRFVLQSLIALLAEVAQNADATQMGPSNLSLVFTPTIVPNASLMSGRTYGIVENLITFHAAVFRDVIKEQTQVRAAYESALATTSRLARRRMLRLQNNAVKLEPHASFVAATVPPPVPSTPSPPAPKGVPPPIPTTKPPPRVNGAAKQDEEEKRRHATPEADQRQRAADDVARRKAEEERARQQTEEEQARQQQAAEEAQVRERQAAAAAAAAQLPPCAACGQRIDSAVGGVKALNKSWHQQCFVCNACKQPLLGGSFVNKEGRPYCKACTTPMCAKCGQPATAPFVRAFQKAWCLKCFVCNRCGGSLTSGYYDRGNGQPLCKTCNEQSDS
eukprot:TRINITY_DN4122_c0_g3_i1.p1 TRINITY_DN4122_c0_g3~~TRINITY_DN4122_c0_g3_i1.p1  ORF type:complete len:1055 (+),score=298.38 TRINITY_DN4122_c0_g3_i1:34-3198(+)